MKELKEILNLIVTDLEKSAVAVKVLNSGPSDKRCATELAIKEYQDFYDSLRKKIEALP
jgi:hypothetical protein